MKVAIFEYISGGGFLDKPIDTSILSEGYAMLTSILRDFKEAGHTTITILDHRIAKFNPPIKADKILTVSSSDGFEKTILKAIEYSDASLIIAPESQGTLFNLVKMVESLPTILLNSSSEAIRLCSDKGELYESLRKARIRIPNTKRCRFVDGLNSAYRVVKDIGLPVVFKPIDGVGCSGLTIVNDYDRVEYAFDRVKSASSSEDYLIQEFIHGIPASVSLICNSKGCKALTLNLQRIVLHESPSYMGGMVPFIHEHGESALRMSEYVVNLISGLRGYVGVDLILSPDGPVIMEVNPRLTVSYVGLRFVGSENPASLILNSIVNNELPERFNTHGYASFSKVYMKDVNREGLLRAYSLDGVLAPPFKIRRRGPYCGFILGWGESVANAESSLEEVRKGLIDVMDTKEYP